MRIFLSGTYVYHFHVPPRGFEPLPFYGLSVATLPVGLERHDNRLPKAFPPYALASPEASQPPRLTTALEQPTGLEPAAFALGGRRSAK